VNHVHSNEATQACELILQEERRYNIEHDILPSEVAVADRMLSRRLELNEAYAELHQKLESGSLALKALFGIVLSTAAFWSPEKIATARAQRQELNETNRQIGEVADALARLLRRREELQNSSGFSGETHYHVCEVVEAASTQNWAFRWNVQEKLQALSSQFDLKYWPALAEFVDVLADDARAASPVASDPLTAVATEGSRPGLSDFFKALLVAFDEASARNYGPLPFGFKLTDGTIASLANCALGLGPDEIKDAPYVKRLRQRRHEQVSRGQ